MPNKKNVSHHDRWHAEALALNATENPLRVPYDIALNEAGQVARFLFKFWEPTAGLPGLARVKARLPKSTADDIVSLVHATQEAQTKLLLLVDPVVVDEGDRARFLINELESAIDFLLDDDVTEEADAQLAALQAFHAQSGQRSSVLHQALSDYAALAESLKERLAEVDEAFDVALIAEARALGVKLAAAPAVPPPSQEAVKNSVLARNGMLTLLGDRVAQARKGAAHVFRAFPETYREVTSTYERRRRAATRRAKVKEAGKPKGEGGGEGKGSGG